MNACLEIQAWRCAGWQSQGEVESVNHRLRVWLVDDDGETCKVLASLLSRVDGIQCDRCRETTGAAGLASRNPANVPPFAGDPARLNQTRGPLPKPATRLFRSLQSLLGHRAPTT